MDPPKFLLKHMSGCSMHYLIIFFFTDLDLAFSLRVVNCSRNPMGAEGKV